jgi:hypothetical protein
MEKGKVGETYHTAGEALSVEELFKMAQEITGIPTPMVMPASVSFASLMSVVEKLFLSSASSRRFACCCRCNLYGDSSKARRELGFTPRPARGCRTAPRNEPAWHHTNLRSEPNLEETMNRPEVPICSLPAYIPPHLSGMLSGWREEDVAWFTYSWSCA